MPDYELIIYGDRNSLGDGFNVGHFFIELRGPRFPGGESISTFHGRYPSEVPTTVFGNDVDLNAIDRSVIQNDHKRYEEASREPGRLISSRPIILTQAQFQSAVNAVTSASSGGTYVLAGNNCVTFVQEIYQAAGQMGDFAVKEFTPQQLADLGSKDKGGAAYYALATAGNKEYAIIAAEGISEQLIGKLKASLGKSDSNKEAVQTYTYTNREYLIVDHPATLRYPLSNLAALYNTTPEQLKSDNPSLPGETGTDGVEYLVYRPHTLIQLPDGTQMDIGELLIQLQLGLLQPSQQSTLEFSKDYEAEKAILMQQFAGVRLETGKAGKDNLSGMLNVVGYMREWVEDPSQTNQIEEQFRVILDAKGGDDRLQGFLGNDLLIGGLGNDTYAFYDYRFGIESFQKLLKMDTSVRAPDSGQDVILEEGGTSDTVLFYEPTKPEDLEVQREENNLAVIYKNHPDNLRMTIINWFVDPSYQIENFEFYGRTADGKNLIEEIYSASDFFKMVGFHEALQVLPKSPELLIQNPEGLPSRHQPFTYLTSDLSGGLMIGAFLFRVGKNFGDWTRRVQTVNHNGKNLSKLIDKIFWRH